MLSRRQSVQSRGLRRACPRRVQHDRMPLRRLLRDYRLLKRILRVHRHGLDLYRRLRRGNLRCRGVGFRRHGGAHSSTRTVLERSPSNVVFAKSISVNPRYDASV